MSTNDPKSKPDPGNVRGAPAPRRDAPVTTNVTGRVKFDDRGNAVWEWAVHTGSFGTDISTSRLKKLDNQSLSLVDEAPPPVRRVKENPQGVVQGYSPYDSGLLAKKEPPRKKDLRRLSEWLKLKKQADANKQGDD